MKPLLVLLAAGLPVLVEAAVTVAPEPITHLLGATDQGILSIDQRTGRATPFAGTGLDQLVNWSFAVDSERHAAYLLGRSRGSFAISTIDLLTGSTSAVTIGGFPALGVYRGLLLGSNGTTISRIDPATGRSGFFASTGLDTGVNFQFVVDEANHVAYELGRRNGAFAVSTIDLLSRTSSIANVSGFPALQVYNGQLVGSDGRSIFEIDPLTGATSVIASTGLDGGVNFQFVVDSANDLAFHLGQRNGAFSIAVVNLETTRSWIVPAPGLVTLDLYVVPEPGFATLGCLILGGLCLRRRRAEMPSYPTTCIQSQTA